jgi:hypothetical protein
MEQSLYLEEVKKYFPGLAARVVEKLNDTKNPLTYLHRRMLTKQYSYDLKWESFINVNGGLVAADVVAMDSSLPLKLRDSLASASGSIPKLGIELALREKQLTELGIIARTPGRTSELLAKLFADTPRVINAQYETLEYMFLLGLSTGVTVIADANNVGTAVRIDYGYLTANKFGVPVLWSNPSSTPLTDLANRPMAKASADGNKIIRFMLDQATWNNIAKTTEANQIYANSIAFYGDVLPVPNFAQLNTATQAQYGFTFEIVERSVRFEKNGVRNTLKPWATGAVVGITSENVGTITYGTLAEMDHPVAGVTYETVDDFMLVSKFRDNRPSLAEFTNSQSLVLPVIEGVDGIYLVDSTTVQA